MGLIHLHLSLSLPLNFGQKSYSNLSSFTFVFEYYSAFTGVFFLIFYFFETKGKNISRFLWVFEWKFILNSYYHFISHLEYHLGDLICCPEVVEVVKTFIRYDQGCCYKDFIKMGIVGYFIARKNYLNSFLYLLGIFFYSVFY